METAENNIQVGEVEIVVCVCVGVGGGGEVL